MTKPCTFPGCKGKAIARGLCAKHNMRLRRHGDPAKVNARGRRDGDAVTRKMMRELSNRSYARFQRGLGLLRLFELNAAPVIAKCTRPNGSVNCAMFERLAEGMAPMSPRAAKTAANDADARHLYEGGSNASGEGPCQTAETHRWFEARRPGAETPSRP